MELITSRYAAEAGWAQPLPAQLDSPGTLVLAFAAAEFGAAPAPLRELTAAFPLSVIVGCSTSGEISGTTARDGSISVAVARFAHTAVRRAITTVARAADSFDAGARLAAQLTGDGLRAVFV